VNYYKLLKSILPDAPLLVGDVVAISNGTATIELPDGSEVQARGEASVSDRVFIRDGVIEGPAPSLTVEIIDV
jgi:hypothetical protein